MKLSELGEFGFIARITPGCTVNEEHVVLGIGDDCAVTRCDGKAVRLVTTDLLVEWVHFLRTSISGAQLGAKSIAVNLSDIAAMGGRALDAFVSIAIPKDVSIEYLDDLYAGMKSVAERYGVNILGGDTTGSKQDLVINVAVTGEAHPDEVLYRSGAQPGDRIYVSGPLGDSAGGLNAISNNRVEENPQTLELVRRHLEPEPHLKQGRCIASTRLAHAMLDVSDGLASDLGHICDQSKLGCEVSAEKIPRSSELDAYCDAHGLDSLALALSGGEDYVLVLTGSPDLPEALSKTDVEVIDIGRIVEGDSRSVNLGGELRPLTPTGWDHLRSS